MIEFDQALKSSFIFQAKNIVTEVLKVNIAIVTTANANMVMDLPDMDTVTDYPGLEKSRRYLAGLDL